MYATGAQVMRQEQRDPKAGYGWLQPASTHLQVSKQRTVVNSAKHKLCCQSLSLQRQLLLTEQRNHGRLKFQIARFRPRATAALDP